MNAILLPHVVAFNLGWLTQKWPAIARQAGWPEASDPFEALDALNRRIGLPSRLSDIGVARADLEAVAAAAMQDNAHKTNPRPMQSADYLNLLQSAY